LVVCKPAAWSGGAPLRLGERHTDRRKQLNHRVWRPALERSKLARHGYRWHDARHTAVSRLIAAGADVALVQAVAGYASAATTLRIYTHLRDSRIKEAARTFDPVRPRVSRVERL
jgi:site-specific recombinase XerD